MRILNIILIVVFLLLLGGAGYVGYYYFFVLHGEVNSVSIPQYIVDNLNERYQQAQGLHEFAFCLKGKIQDGVAMVNSYEEAEVVSYGDLTLHAKCPLNIIGTIHNHNEGICSLSPQDVYTFGKSDHEIIGIICGQDNVYFYTSNNLNQGINIEIFE